MVMSLVLRVLRIHGPDLALDHQGNIHVAANGSNTIKVFTPEGTYVRSHGDVKDPTASDEEGYNLVCEYSGNCLSIFADPRSTQLAISIIPLVLLWIL